MATKKTEKTAAPKAASTTKSTTASGSPSTAKTAKAPKAPKAAKAPQGPRHPHGRVSAAHGGKEALAKSLASVIARAGEDAGELTTKLKKASNAQLLRLQRVSETVTKKWGGRDKLIAAIGSAQNKSKDKDFIAKLESYSLPQLFDLMTSNERRARS